MTTVIVHGDFNWPYSYRASQRADLLGRAGTLVVDWRAVEHDRGLSVTGSSPDGTTGDDHQFPFPGTASSREYTV